MTMRFPELRLRGGFGAQSVIRAKRSRPAIRESSSFDDRGFARASGRAAHVASE
jgi:hypothetical protein